MNFYLRMMLTLLTPFLLIGSAVAQYQVGDVVDDFTLTDIHGQSHTLYEHTGKVVVLNFFTTW